jgi:hypothetical protein
VRSVEPTFGTPDDVVGRSTIQNLQSGAYVAEQKLEERRAIEQKHSEAEAEQVVS